MITDHSKGEGYGSQQGCRLVLVIPQLSVEHNRQCPLSCAS